MYFFFLLLLGHPKSTLTDTLLPYTTLFRLRACRGGDRVVRAIARTAARPRGRRPDRRFPGPPRKRETRRAARAPAAIAGKRGGFAQPVDAAEIGRAHV